MIFAAIASAVAFFLAGMTLLEDEYLASLVFVASGVLAMFILWSETGQKAYREGQIDAHTGKMKYELVVGDDSTRALKLKESAQNPY